MKTIIKGAIYDNGDELLRPHFSGEFSAVDCTAYKKKKQIKEEYDPKIAKEFMSGFYLTFEGEKYYECEWGPYHTANLILLSDLDNINFYDEETEF